MADRASASGVARRGLHAQVVDALGRRILGGQLAEAQVLDLQELEHEFGVSHTAMREAVKVLSAKQLIDARPKLGTYVLARQHWNLLDPDVMAWRDGELKLQTDVAEIRAMLEPAGSALAAQRITPESAGRLTERLAQLEAAVVAAAAKPALGWLAAAEADVAFHLAIAEATGNELLSAFEAMLLPALRARHLATLPRFHQDRFIEEHRAVAEAVCAGDAERAGEAMSILVSNAAEDFVAGVGGDMDAPARRRRRT